MEFVQWLSVGAVVAALPVEFFRLAPFSDKGWKPLKDQMADQVALSVALARECGVTTESGVREASYLTR